MKNCKCQDWQKISKDHIDLFQIDKNYGWIISWLEITRETNFHKTNQYGISINYCPFCGEKLDEPKNFNT